MFSHKPKLCVHASTKGWDSEIAFKMNQICVLIFDFYIAFSSSFAVSHFCTGSLIEQLTTEKYECMVCCEVVRIIAPVWSCQNCYHVFHLNCIKKWARSPASQAEG